MKNFSFDPFALRPLMLGAVCLVASAAGGRAAPGGFASVVNNGQSGVVSAQGNVVTAGSGVAAPAATHGFAGGAVSPGQHIGGLATGGRPLGGVEGGASPAASGNSAPIPQSGFSGNMAAGGGELRAGVGQRTVGPTISSGAGQHIDGGLVGMARPTRPLAMAQPSNAWSETRGTRIAPAARAGHYGYNGAYDGGQLYQHNRLPAGQYLHGGAAAYAPQHDAHPRDWSHRNPGHRSYRSGRYFYGGLYYPYFYGAALPVYAGYFDGGYGASLGVDTDATLTGDLSSNTDTDNGRGYWERRSIAPQEDAALALPPNAPAQAGPATPDVNNERRVPAEIGPDSLVEAVQAELAARGYFAGKVNAMYGESTREALRRFQADRKLAVTGRINEATLHALQLD